MTALRFRTALQQAADDLFARRERVHALRLQAHVERGPGQVALRLAGLGLAETLMQRAEDSVYAAIDQLDQANRHLQDLAARDPLLRDQRLHVAPAVVGGEVIDLPFRELPAGTQSPPDISRGEG